MMSLTDFFVAGNESVNEESLHCETIDFEKMEHMSPEPTESNSHSVLMPNSFEEATQFNFCRDSQSDFDLEVDEEVCFTESRSSESLTDKLLMFYVLFNISNRAMQYLLKILIEEGFDVPKSLYLLKKKPISTKINVARSLLACGGQFVYFSILDSILFCVRNNLVTFVNRFNELKIAINIDGLSPFKSSPVTLWPILISFRNTVFRRPLPVGLYVGKSKPDFHGFVTKLHEELIKLKSDFVHVVDDIHVKVVDVLFICDAPARNFVQCLKSFASYNPCNYCRIEGVHTGKKMIFPYNTGLSFQERDDGLYESGLENNQISRSPFCDVSSMKYAYPPEYMHSVCLGVVRRMIYSYMSNTYGLLSCRLSQAMKNALNESVDKFKNTLPCEFSRKVRSFDQYRYFKATEYRTILLYTGPVFFQKTLPPSAYRHFLLLHFSIYILANPRLRHLVANAKSCINLFLYGIRDIFGMEAYTYNSHCLLHLTDFVNQLGPLDSFSAFPFENFLHILKRRIKSGSFIFSQSVNCFDDIRKLYSSDTVRKLVFSGKKPDNCALIEYKAVYVPVEITYFENDVIVSARIMKFVEDLYTYPYPSSSIGIGKYIVTNEVVTNVLPVSKCVAFYDERHVTVIPFASNDIFE